MPAWVWFRGFHSLVNSSILIVPLSHDDPVIVHCECPCIIRLVCTLPSQHHPECHALLGTHILSILTCPQLALTEFTPLSFGALVLFYLSWILSGCLQMLPSAQCVHTNCPLWRRCFAYVMSACRACVVHAAWPVPSWPLHIAGILDTTSSSLITAQQNTESRVGWMFWRIQNEEVFGEFF